MRKKKLHFPQISDDKSTISKKLQTWYEEHKRDLPWRHTRVPYKIWISEVILQQTRVAQGIDYYRRFVARFPDVEALAKADEDAVLKLWQGLGYYSRARNLHAAAKQIVTQFHAKFPDTYIDLLALRGVGEYTAAAIASIAFGEPRAVIDGNVFRVLSRLFAIEEAIDTPKGKKIISALAIELLDAENPARHNQAVMEFGALHCTPNAPKCAEGCPLQEKCMAFAMKRTDDFPVKNRKISVKNRYFHYFHIVENGYTYICKRHANDVWKNLYEFPLIETGKVSSLEVLMLNPDFEQLFSTTHPLVFHKKLSRKHVLSHQVIHAVFYLVEISTPLSVSDDKMQRIHRDALSIYPVSRLIHRYLETITDETLRF